MPVDHTPGPWRVDLTGPFTLGGDAVPVEAVTDDGKHVRREICTCLLDTDSHPDGAEWQEDAANARLIAAAPDLLAAARRMRNSLGRCAGQISDLFGHDEEFAAAEMVLLDAILKAEGRGKDGTR